MVLQVKVAWWLRLYLGAVTLTATLLQCDINEERVGWWISRGIRVKEKRRG